MHQILLLLPTSLPQANSASEQRFTLWTLAADGSPQAQRWSLPELLAQPQASRAELLLLLPMHSLSWHTSTLPAGLRLTGDNRLLPLLQNLLEEQLLQEPGSYHIALPPQASAQQQAAQPSLLAACQHDWLHQWVELLEHNGLSAARILPFAPPELLANAPLCWEDEQHQPWLAVLHHGQPLTLPMQASAAAYLPQPLPPAHLQCLPAAAAEASRLWGSDAVALLPDAAWAQAVSSSAWNLAQHRLAAGRKQRLQRQGRKLWQDLLAAPQWRSTRWGVVALAAVAVLGLNARWWWASHSLAQQQAAVQQATQQAFPELTVIVDAPLQMQRALQTLRQQARVMAADDLLPLLSVAGQALQELSTTNTALTEPLRISRISYNGERLILSLSGFAPASNAAQSAQLHPQLHTQLEPLLSSRGYRLLLESNGAEQQWVFTPAAP